MLKKPRLLQIFSKYLQYGGEEGSMHRIGETMRDTFEVDTYITSTEDLLKGGIGKKMLLPLLAFYRPNVARELRRLQERERFDVWQIHNVFPAISPAAYRTAFLLGVPVVHYLHNYRFGSVNSFLFANGREYRDGLHGNFIPAIQRKEWRNSYLQTAAMAAVLTYARRMDVFHKVHQWIAISEAQKRLHVEMGIPAGKIAVVPHFLETEPSRPAAVMPEKGYALFIGRLSPEKGVNRLLDAWRLVPPHRELRIAGSGPCLEELQEQAARLALKNVKFLGFVPKEQHEALWEGAAFSVIPSIWQEPFGMVVLEAWAQGRPVVAHRIGALPEIVRSGETGFLADPDNPQDLALTLENAFAAGGSRLSEMGAEGRRLLSGYYSKNRWLEDITMVYRNAGLI